MDSIDGKAADGAVELHKFNRSVIGTEVIFSFPIGPALVSDVIAALPSPFYAVITDDIVHELYGRALVQSFVEQGASASAYIIPNGEPCKNRRSKELIEDWMVSAPRPQLQRIA
jgi:3-dehydroquinate synthetase